MFAGIDVGSLTAQAVLLSDADSGRGSATEPFFRSIRVRTNPLESARAVMGELLDELGIGWNDISYCVSTGYGRDMLQDEGIAQRNVSEISCHGLGAFSATGNVRTIIDIGGQDAKVIRVDNKGEMIDFVMNDKCAAGTGRFLEVMSRTIGITYEELGPLAQTARGRVELSSRCSIFTETEVLPYEQRGVETDEIAAGICRSMAERVMTLVRRVGVEQPVMMTGGVAKNIAVKSDMERMLNTRMLISQVDPQIMGALGAAAFAKRMHAS